MKNLKEHLTLISAIASLISAITTVIFSYIPSNELKDFRFWFVILLSSSVILVLNIILSLLVKDREAKIKSLFILSEQKRIHTLNFILFLESLSKNRPQEYGIKNKPCIGNSSYCFHVHNNNVDNSDMADVDYNHTFDIGSHKKIFNTLILYSAGELVNDKVKCEYNNHEINRTLNELPSIVKNKQNSRIMGCELGLDNHENNISKNKFLMLFRLKKYFKNNINVECNHLTFKYYTKNCHSVFDDEVFIIVPKNYGSRFLGEANIILKFDNTNDGINAVFLHVLQLNKGKYHKVGAFDYNGKEYSYNIRHLDLNSIYFVVIKRKN